MSGPGQFFLIRPRQAVIDQAHDAMHDIIEANGGDEPATLYDAADVEPRAFARLIEALVQLGVPVDDEMTRRAGIVDINELM